MVMRIDYEIDETLHFYEKGFMPVKNAVVRLIRLFGPKTVRGLVKMIPGCLMGDIYQFLLYAPKTNNEWDLRMKRLAWETAYDEDQAEENLIRTRKDFEAYRTGVETLRKYFDELVELATK